MASIRYLVNDVEASIKFYSESLDFELKQQFGPAMAILSKGDLTLWLAGPMSSAAKPMPDGSIPRASGSQVLCEDPSGNLIELFQPLAKEN